MALLFDLYAGLFVEEAARTYIDVAADFGLTVSVPKTKLMVTGRRVTPEDRTPIPVGDC